MTSADNPCAPAATGERGEGRGRHHHASLDAMLRQPARRVST
jgi:hypothetical protein